jgi:hypothetical protein
VLDEQVDLRGAAGVVLPDERRVQAELPQPGIEAMIVRRLPSTSSSRCRIF